MSILISHSVRYSLERRSRVPPDRHQDCGDTVVRSQSGGHAFLTNVDP